MTVSLVFLLVMILRPRDGLRAATGLAALATPFATADVPDVGPVPALSAVPTDVPWPDEEKTDLEKAVANCRHNPVWAQFAFKDALCRKEWKNGGLTPEQRAWLEQAIERLREYVQNLLERDYKKAIAAGDVRAALIASEIAGELEGGEGDNSVELLQRVAERPELLDLVHRAMAGKLTSPPVWRISAARAVQIESYSETRFLSTTTVAPKGEGEQLIRVTATIENISDESDPIYAPCAMPSLLRRWFHLDHDVGNSPHGPRRHAAARYLWLLTSQGPRPCVFVCEDAKTLKGGSVSASLADLIGSMASAGSATCAGSYVEKGAPFTIDVLFIVPKDATDLKLLSLGSPPVPLSASADRAARTQAHTVHSESESLTAMR